VLSGGYAGTIRSWDLSRPSRPLTLRKQERDLSVHGIAVARDGGRAIVADVDGLSVWDLALGRPVSRIDHDPNHGARAFAATPEGTQRRRRRDGPGLGSAAAPPVA
jgi:WD40 repeat protein